MASVSRANASVGGKEGPHGGKRNIRLMVPSGVVNAHWSQRTKLTFCTSSLLVEANPQIDFLGGETVDADEDRNGFNGRSAPHPSQIQIIILLR